MRTDTRKVWETDDSRGIRHHSLPHLCHLFSVGFGVERSLGQQSRVFLGRHSQLIVECVMPDLKKCFRRLVYTI